MGANGSRSPTHAPSHRRQPRETARPAPQGAAALVSQAGSVPADLLADPRLSGHSNGPVRQAVLLHLQRSQGNRAARRLVQRSTAPASGSAGAVQRKIFLRDKPAAPKPVTEAIAAVRQYLADGGSLRYVKKAPRNHPLFDLLVHKKAYKGREEALLQLIETWLADDITVMRDFRDWEDALGFASLVLTAQESEKARSPEEREKQNRKFQELLAKLPEGEKEKLVEPERGSKREKEHAESLAPLTRQASLATDIFGTPKSEDDPLFLPLRRRKLHKSGKGDLPGYEIRYRTYKGTISPKANAFVLGGDLPTDYGPLLREVVTLIHQEFLLKKFKPPSDAVIAGLFLKEMSGADAFADFSKEVQIRVHKIIAIILFAELSRHSIALVTAAASFHAVATRGEKEAEPALVESFETGSRKERPLFAGTGGPDLMRNEGGQVEGMTDKDVLTRRARGAVDLLNFLRANQQKGEELGDVLQRKTLEYLFALAQHTDERSYKVAWMTDVLYRLLRRVLAAKKVGDAPTVTLVALGFTHHAMPGDENDCAVYSLFDQLTRRHGLVLGDRQAFVDYVRGRMGGPMGVMIDLVAQGAALLAAARTYMTDVLHLAAPHLAINVWASTGDGGLMEFNNVAASGGGALACVFYYNGEDHFDSLSGNLGA